MKIKSVLVFFCVVFILNYVINWAMHLGQDLRYILFLSLVTTVLFYLLNIMRGRWTK